MADLTRPPQVAQAKLGPLVSAIAGSIAGTTFQRMQAAAQIRSKPLPRYRATTYTNSTRQLTGTLARMWKTLTPEQRAYWGEVAESITWYNRFGDEIRGLGYWLFLRCNQYRILVGQSIVTDAVLPGTFETFAGMACTFAATPAMSLTWDTPTNVPADYSFAVFATPPISAGRSKAFGLQRFIGLVPEGASSPYNLLDLYHNRFAQYPDGSRISLLTLRLVELNTGHIGPPIAVTASP